MKARRSIKTLAHRWSHQVWSIQKIAVATFVLALLSITGWGFGPSAFAGNQSTETLPTLRDFPQVKIGPHTHIESVRLTLDMFDSVYERKVKRALKLVEGVDRITLIRDLNLVEVFPKQDFFLDLYDLRSAVNSIRGLNVIRMDVIVAGKLDTFIVRHFETGPDPHPHVRHKFVAGDKEDEMFILVEDAKLKELLKAGYQQAILVGIVPAFEGHTPILKITDFTKQESNDNP